MRLFCLAILLFSIAVSGCAVPSLETPACTESKNAVREFYSFHFGNEMKFGADTLAKREKYLSPEFAQSLKSTPENADPFTSGSTDIPKAFRVGECTETSPEKTNISVLIFWRDDTRTEQREIKVEAVDRNDKWLVNNISR